MDGRYVTLMKNYYIYINQMRYYVILVNLYLDAAALDVSTLLLGVTRAYGCICTKWKTFIGLCTGMVLEH